ncbi:CsbD family protein [Streptomyces sp. NPDC018045]|uniref:CsbD family protein n=1 Tax=Streptomyces sp. NPDC018045 TaxID=3365037 RepID=UPI003798CE7B
MGDKSAVDKVKGKAKEMKGAVTGDDRTKAEGRTDQAKGKAKGAMDEAKSNVQGMRDSLKNKGDRST